MLSYKEEQRDLFSVSEEYYLSHCISADFAMGKGIAVEFNRRFDMKKKLMEMYPDYLREYEKEGNQGDCILEGRVLNLVTKKRYYNKPTYESLRTSLEKMKQICVKDGISKIAMPLIGCGLDKLDWKQVSGMIQEVFQEMELEILVCIKY